MKWYFFPSILLMIGLIGLILTIRAFKNGQGLSIKKLFAIVMLVLLGGGVFLQKMEVINIPQLAQLLMAFDTEAREKNDQQKLIQIEERQQEFRERMLDVSKKANKAKK